MNMNILKDISCSQCSLKFGTKVWYELHLTLVHGQKNNSESFDNNSKRKQKDADVLFESSNFATNQKVDHELNMVKEEKLTVKNHKNYEEKEVKCKQENTKFEFASTAIPHNRDYNLDIVKQENLHVQEDARKIEYFENEVKSEEKSKEFSNDLSTIQVFPSESQEAKLCNFKQENFDEEAQFSFGNENQTPFRCSFCKVQFATRQKLSKHLDSVHGDKKTFKCVECNSSFIQRPHLYRHIKTVHKG